MLTPAGQLQGPSKVRAVAETLSACMPGVRQLCAFCVGAQPYLRAGSVLQSHGITEHWLPRDMPLRAGPWLVTHRHWWLGIHCSVV